MKDAKKNEVFCQRFRELAEEKNASAVVIGKLLGRERKSVYFLMRGETEPRLSELVRLAEFFGVSIDYLAGLTDWRDANHGEEPAEEVPGRFFQKGWG